MEQFLPWWLMHLREQSDLPVLFADFGMSPEGRKFCEEKGELVPMPAPDFVVQRKDVSLARALLWETVFTPEFWRARRAWFLKPFALLASPFDRSLWIDIDCEVRESLGPLFQGTHIAMTYDQGTSYHERGLLSPGAPSYSTGVIGVSHGDPLIVTWAERCMKENHLFLNEQLLLSQMVGEIHLLPQRYNWHMRMEGCPDIAIAHYGGKLKALLQERMHARDHHRL